MAPSAPEPTATTTVPPFRVTSGFWESLPPMPIAQYPGTDAYIDDVYVNPEGSPMCSGYFEFRHTDAPLDYYYEYDEMKIVIEGEFRLENADTGQVQIARARRDWRTECRHWVSTRPNGIGCDPAGSPRSGCIPGMCRPSPTRTGGRPRR